MPRGKYVKNHKGRSRHFTSPEFLEQEKDESSDQEENSSEEEEGAVGSSGTNKVRSKPKVSRAKKIASSEEEDSNEESSEEEDRSARKGVAGLIDIENPNRVSKKKLNDLTLDDESAPKPELTRREREQIEKQKARLRYEKLHAAGKTTEAKADLARLALIRQQRSEAAAKREAEKKAQDEKKIGSSNKK